MSSEIPPPRRSFTSEAEPVSIDDEPQLISEIAIDATVIVAPAPDAVSAAAMTASVPRLDAAMIPASMTTMSPAATPGHSEPPAPKSPSSPPVRPLDTASRTTVAPVTATLDRDPRAPIDELPLPRFRGRLSVDSKMLVAGGAVAAAMLLVALAVMLGRPQLTQTAAMSTASAPATPATTAQSPAPSPPSPPSDAKNTTATASAPPAEVEMPAPAATEPPTIAVTALAPAQPRAEKPAAPAVTTMAAPAPGSPSDLSLTIDVSQLPAARAPRGRWAAKSPRSAPAQAPAGDTAPQAPSGDTPSSPSAASPGTDETPAPAPAAAPSATVDPFVQAVREDIKEDESTKSPK